MPAPVARKSSGGVARVEAHSEGVGYLILSQPKKGVPAGADELALEFAAAGAADALCEMATRQGYSCRVSFAGEPASAGRAGLQYRVELSRCGEVGLNLIRSYATGRRLYTLVVTGAREDDPQVTRFLNGFTLRGGAGPPRTGRRR